MERNFRSSPRRCSVKKEVLKKIGISTRKQACNFIKKRIQHRCFPVNIANFSRTFFWGTSGNDCFQTLQHKFNIRNPNLGILNPSPPPSRWFTLNNSEAATLAFRSIQWLFIRDIVSNLVSLTCPSLKILGKTQTGVFFDFRISGQSLVTSQNLILTLNLDQ